jgi:predicted DNA-binding WGR domain protein
MNSKWCLLKESDGTRGANGKKKVYEIVIDGSIVRTSWGMAEKTRRQHSSQYFATESAARQFAFNKRYEKLAKGYELAYAV